MTGPERRSVERVANLGGAEAHYWVYGERVPGENLAGTGAPDRVAGPARRRRAGARPGAGADQSHLGGRPAWTARDALRAGRRVLHAWQAVAGAGRAFVAEQPVGGARGEPCDDADEGQAAARLHRPE